MTVGVVAQYTRPMAAPAEGPGPLDRHNYISKANGEKLSE